MKQCDVIVFLSDCAFARKYFIGVTVRRVYVDQKQVEQGATILVNHPTASDKRTALETQATPEQVVAAIRASYEPPKGESDAG